MDLLFKWFIFAALLCPTIIFCSERRVISRFTPGCNNTCNFTVVYVGAIGQNDTLHYIWDFSRKPSVLLARTSVKDEISFNWTAFMENKAEAIKFTKPVLYSFGLIFNKVIEFNDLNDNGIIDKDDPVYEYDTELFTWKQKDLHQDPNLLFFTLDMVGQDENKNKTINGTLGLQLTAFGNRDHDNEFPKLLHSQNSTQIKLQLDRFSTNSSFENARFAVQLILASDDNHNSTSVINSRKSLDDENTPGVFKVVDVLTPSSQSSGSNGGFLLWRPIVYVTNQASISNSTETVTYELTNIFNPNLELNKTLLYNFYGDSLDQKLVQLTTVSFGAKDDGFYKKTNYTSWTFLLGYGGPEKERFSMLVILVMSIGLGVPAILIIFGGLYMCVRLCRRNKDQMTLER